VLDLLWDRYAEAHATRWAPTALPPRPSPEDLLVALRLLDEVRGASRVYLPPDPCEDL
jgi:hypothetical protein